MNKENIMETLNEYKNDFGVTYADAEPDAMNVIEAALDLYFLTLNGNKNNINDNPSPCITKGCSPATRSSCCGCPEYSAWIEKKSKEEKA